MWYVCEVLVPFIHHDFLFILLCMKVGKAACTSFQASTHHVLRSLPTTALEERPEERRKTPYSLDINLITMRLSIWGGCD